VTAVIVIRCPQQAQGSKKLGRFDRMGPLKDTKALSRAPIFPLWSFFSHCGQFPD
jgi:hypothetical protein